MSDTGRMLVALEFPRAEQAGGLVDELGDRVDTYKLGLQSLTAAGPQVVDMRVDAGKSVFLDLKLHEIPHSAASAVRVCGQLGVDGDRAPERGSAVLQAAVEAAAETPQLRVVALTVITRLNDVYLAEVGVPRRRRRAGRVTGRSGARRWVPRPGHRSAGDLRKPGCDAVGSAHSGARLNVLNVSAHDRDHARSGTVAHAIADGATHVVPGRSLTHSAYLRQAVDHALEPIAAATKANGRLSPRRVRRLSSSNLDGRGP